MKRNSVWALLFAVFFLIAAEPGSEQYNQDVLDDVWSTVARNHYRRDFDRHYRQSVYEKHRPAVLRSKNIPELVTALNRMLQSIGDSHLRLYGPVSDMRRKMLQNTGKEELNAVPSDPGFTVIAAGRRILVWQVRSGSAADKAGVKPGDELLAVDSAAIPAEENAMPPWSMLVRAALERGGEGSVCKVRLRNAAGTVRDLELPRSAHGGQVFRAANLPGLVLRYHAEMLDRRTGYVQFNFFMPETIRRFRSDLRHGVLRNARNLVLDLRGNPGGVLLAAEWLGSWCVRMQMPLGTLVIGGVRLNPVTEPQPGCFSGRLVLLTDRDTMSTGELFAAAVQDARAGIVIGEATPGWCLPSMFLNLRNGFRLQTVSGQALRPGGQSVEKNGVRPDIAVPNGFADGHDQTVAAALQYLAGKNK